ncbi:sister chromatid cohesion protein DCC1-like [Artemia franciscana]|uniref:Sister chromatid cohesion protein DCC1 n=1 Tax=Artemia franciscana TaxID=6661 RepID=A0AA88I1G0_ARTSF|nr:hypothetical protein QYM36_003476 [Artemia franciscana]
MSRSLENVLTVIEKAKLDDDSLLSLSQLVYYSGDINQENSKVFELPKELLEDLKSQKRFVIRGNENDSAVLCTDSATYDMTEAETSNLLLAVPELSVPQEIPESEEGRVLKIIEVRKAFQTYFELKPTKPKLKRLREMLQSRLYNGPELEMEVDSKTLTFDELCGRIQASEKELKDALDENHAFILNGEFRILDIDYCYRTWSLIEGVKEENSWSLNSMKKSVILESISHISPVYVIEAFLKRFCHISDEDEDIISLNHEEIARFFGEFLFNRNQQYSLTEFLSYWQESVPEGVVVDIKHLSGLAIAKPESQPPVIRFFPEYDLPEDVPQRFMALFAMKPKWTLEEITPYLIRLVSSSKDVNALLTKHSRASVVNGVRYFSAKHGN